MPRNKIIKLLSNLPRNKFFKLFILFLVFYFTFVLRAHNYDRVPTSNHLDEMLYAWSGLYLVETGTPVSWSTLDYPDRAQVYKGRISYKGGIPETYVTLYRPWLDEPPLFSLIVGSFAHFFGADRNDFVPSSYIRFPIIFISALTSVFIFLIARKVSGFWTGLLAMLIYGTVPIFVFASRTAMPENLIALFLVILIYLYLLYAQKLKPYLLLPIPFLIGFAGLSKPTGYFLLPIALFLTFLVISQTQNIKKALLSCIYITIAVIPFIAAFFAWGMFLDPEIFWGITGIQSHRPVGFGSLAWFFITPSFDTAIMRDSWYVFALLCSAYFVFQFSFKYQNYKEILFSKGIVIFAFVYWVMVVMISGGENDLLAWYRFPAIPFMAIMAAWGIQILVKKADFLAMFIAAGMLLGNKMLLVNPFRPNIQPMQYRLLFSGLMLPSVLAVVFKKDIFSTISRVLIILIIIVGVYLNTKFIYNAFEIICEAQTCPLVPSTWLSTLHYPLLWRLIELEPPYYPWEN